MKIEFRFNGAHQIILQPENGKDKALLALAFGDHPVLRLGSVPAEGGAGAVMIVAEETQKKEN